MNNKYQNQEIVRLGKKEYIYLDTLPVLAIQIARKHNIDIEDLKLKFALVDPEIRPAVAGQCMLVKGQHKLLTDVDYLITFSEIVWDSINEEQRELLMLHELMHIFKDYDNDGNLKLKLARHDVQDFRYLIKQYGVDWIHAIEDVKEIMDAYKKALEEKKSKKKENE